MKKILFTIYTRDNKNQLERVLSVFPLVEDIGEAEAETLVASQLASMAPISALHFVGCEEFLVPFRKLMGDPESILSERVFGILKNEQKSTSKLVLFFSFDPTLGNYSISSISSIKSQKVPSEKQLKEERDRTLADAFVRCGGEEKAPGGIHFAKTSKSHSDRFLRVSRAFELTEHVQLAAFWLLAHIWRVNPKFIVLDTSGLHALALTAASYLVRKNRFKSIPLIWSHSSHDGVSSLGPEIKEGALFLISASTSGGLSRKLHEIGVSPESIVTCFALLPSPSINLGQVVCDLSQGDHGGLELIQSYSPDHCKFCESKAQLITIEGDQFSFVPPRVEKILIEAKDLDLSTKTLMSALAGRGVFRLYRRDASDSQLVRDVWINSDAVVNRPLAEKAKPLQKALSSWQHYVSQAMTWNLTKIIASEYAGSAELANYSLRSYRYRKGKIHGIRTKELNTLPPEPGKGAAIFVSAIDRQDELISFSRSLRSFQPDGSISYLSLFSLFPTSKDRDALASAITFGSHGRQTFRLNYLFTIDLEIDSKGGSWRRELETLRRLRHEADEKGRDVPNAIDARIVLLEAGLATGLIDEALWPAPNGELLKLRSDFTLLDWSLEDPKANTADLYVLFSVILNKLRTQNGARRLAQNPYQRTVLAQKISTGLATESFKPAFSGQAVTTSLDMLTAALKLLGRCSAYYVTQSSRGWIAIAQKL